MRSTLLRRLVAAAFTGALVTGPMASGAVAVDQRPSIEASVVSFRADEGQTMPPLRGVVLVARPVKAGYPTVVYKGSDENGVIDRVASGRLYEGRYRLTYYDDSEEHVPLVAPVVEIRSGGTSLDTVRMQRRWTMTGTVMANNGTPAPGVDVWANYPGPSGALRVSAKTRSDGTFTLAGLPEAAKVYVGYGFTDREAEQIAGVDAGGYRDTEWPNTRPRVAWIKVRPTISATAAAYGTGAAKVSGSVSFRGVASTGNVAVVVDGKQVTGTYKALTSDGDVGRFAYLVKGLKKGKHTIRVHYYGSIDVRGGDSATRTITVK